MHKNITKAVLGIFAFSFIFLVFSNVVFAAPEFMVSWKSPNYAPSWFQGKVIPTKDSRVDVSFELIDNGSVVNLSQIPVRWYIDGKLTKNENTGLGQKNATFFIPNYSGGTTEIKIDLPSYKGQEINKTISIPSKLPEIVLESNSLDNTIKKGMTKFSAWPFFFNFSNLANLDLIWKINGQDVRNNSANQLVLNVNVNQNSNSGAKVLVEVEAQNLKFVKEYANKKLNLEVK